MMSSSQDRFVAAAVDHGKFTASGDFKSCNKAYDKLVVTARELTESPDSGTEFFLDLLNYPDDSVRSWASVYLLQLQPEKAVRTLEEVASHSGLVAFSAGMALKEWRAGRLKLP